MGLFSSLFGSTSSDAAEKSRQDALNAFNAIKTPDLSALQVQLQKYVDAGTLTPEQAETQLLSSNAFNEIATDPSYVGAQKQALQQLQAVATQGGLTAVDRAQLNDINNAQNQQNQSQNAATMQQAQQRGVGGSDLTAVNQLINEQGAANRAANSGVQVAANAQQRALQAMQAAGNTGNALESQAYGEQANKANAQNAIDLYNNQALNQTNLYNTQASNAAQASNLANQQAVSNANTQTGNANTEYNAQQNQTLYNDQLQKAQDIANTDLSSANASQAAQNADQAGTVGLLSSGVQAVGSAFGPVSALVTKAATSQPGTTSSNSQFGTVYDPTQNQMGMAEGGEVEDPESDDHMAMGGHVHCYAYGGQAYHHPECMAQGGFLSGLKKGALHRDLGVPQGEKIPTRKVEKATHSDNETLRKRAQFAENAKHWQHHDEGGNVPADNTIDPTAAQDFMSGMRGTPNPSMPVEWSEDSRTWTLRDKTGNKVGEFSTFPEALGFMQKIEAQKAKQPMPQTSAVRDYKGGEIDFRAGGHVPGRAKVEGDSPKNDTVDAKLSPGEIVVPRSAANDEDEFQAFMAKFNPAKKKMAMGGMMPPAAPPMPAAIPRVNETNPMRDTAKVTPGNPVPLAATNDANDFTHLMAQGKPKKLPKGPSGKIPPEVRALANLHSRVSNLEGRKI
jgi:hypothetical protein